MEGKRRKTNYWFWGILFIVLAGGIVWCYRSTLIAGRIKFAVAETGTIRHERSVAATFANQELTVLTPLSGKVQYIGEDGQRLRRGETVAVVQPEGAAPGTMENAQNQTITAAMGGLFFRQSDGLESVLTSENLISMDLNKLLTQTSSLKTSEATVQKGEVLGKIVNNLIPTMAFLETPNIDELTVGKTMRVTAGNQTISAKVLRKSDQPKGVIVQFPHYIDGTAAQRRQEVSWIYRPPTNGVLIPKSALWTQGEELGVFLWSEGVVQFKKVKVLDEDDKMACIMDLPNGIPVVITPRDGLEGLVANVKNI
ncbi:HlyD family efflux transporter periplasmic adaptor subunit [Desulfosporosinus lacus]|uniref:Putative membrane fusion protein n=1 Tax=Desulfosporosinus lacus DSM 15449 TaxID=1121420 RepID=A0A1M5ULD8_9FIRM|nr:HlyD family efflux transporter periplasmic adaptor subunit [Desulfosporosinus lacus]SHH63809.1 putative membrane fusion protein [Desulfosporosinus lacus DSM 15449]